MKNFIQKTFEKTKYGRLVVNVYFLFKYYLRKEGWIESSKNFQSIDKDSNPIPWFTYPCFHFIENKISASMNVFEFGSGNSTIWFSKKTKSIISIEHNELWYKQIVNNLKDSIQGYYYKDLKSEEYENSISEQSENFSIVIVDGRKRVRCIKNSIHKLKEDGVLILDNSEREYYNEGIDLLLSKNFKRLDFWGLGPGNHRTSCTTIFYRESNCLSI